MINRISALACLVLFAGLIAQPASAALRLHRAALKNQPGPASGGETTVLNIPSGAGEVHYLWIADRPGRDGGYPQFDEHIRIYANGATAPQVDTDLGLFFGYAGGSEFATAGNLSTLHWQARVGGTAHLDRYGGSTNLMIPFQNGIRIALANTNNTPVSAVFAQADYALATDNPTMKVPAETLYVAGNSWQGGRLAALAGSSATLATIPPGQPGVIIGESMVGGGAADYSYLERQIAVTVDGEASPSILSSGTEDWFGGSDYFFSGQSPFSSTWSMGMGAQYQSNTYPCEFSALVDFLAMNGGYAFNSSATITWLDHPAVDTSNTFGTAVFYYRDIPIGMRKKRG